MLNEFFMGAFLLVGTDQTVLDGLYENLQKAPTESEAAEIASDIQSIWNESGSPTVDLLMRRGIEAEQRKDIKLAKSIYDRIVIIDPDYHEVWFRRARLNMLEDNYSEALKDMNATLEREPRHYYAWLGLAAIAERLGGSHEALEAIQESLAIYPDFQPAKDVEKRLKPELEGLPL